MHVVHSVTSVVIVTESLVNIPFSCNASEEKILNYKKQILFGIYDFLPTKHTYDEKKSFKNKINNKLIRHFTFPSPQKTYTKYEEMYNFSRKTTTKPIKWIICFLPVLSIVFFGKGLHKQ